MGEEHTNDPQFVTKRFSWEDLDELVTHYAKQMTPDALSYLEARGIDEKTVENFRLGFESARIGFHSNGKGMLGGFFSNCIIFPIVDVHGKVVDLVGRTIDSREPKYRSLMGRTETFFNHPVLGQADDVVLVRNVFDVLSLTQIHLPAICQPDLSPFKEQQVQALTEKRVFICYPNDDAGRRESVRISSMLEGVASEVYMVHLPEGIRDVNDLFVRAKEPQELFMGLLNEAISENLKMPVFPDVRSLTVFTEEYAKRQKGMIQATRTGFSDLDQQLTGGLTAGLYLLIGAVSSGKSMLLRQIADQIAESGTPVIYISWEMSSYQLWCRSMARVLKVPPRDIMAGNVELQKVAAAAQAYAETAKNMWTIEGTFESTLHEIEETINRVILSIGKAPVIFIDDLFRITLRDEKGNLIHNNQAMSSYALHRWARQWNTPVITSASSNKTSGVEIHPLVEAAVDTIIYYESLSSKTASDQQFAEITLRLLKNRNGTLGSINLIFHKDKAEFSSSHP